MELLKEHPHRSLICLTVIMPGKVKRNEYSLIVAQAAMRELRERSNLIEVLEEKDLKTGFEAYALTALNTLEAKRLTCEIEESSPLGRLFDLDVIDHQGAPVSREAINLPPRRCLLCENEARYCMRNHSHSQEEIQNKIKEIVKTKAELSSHPSPLTSHL